MVMFNRYYFFIWEIGNMLSIDVRPLKAPVYLRLEV